MELPLSLMRDLSRIPCDRHVTLVMRHSARYPITNPAETYIVGLTEEGVHMAEAFGARLGKAFRCGRLLASPVGRCLATADAIAAGAGWQARVMPDERLSHPHIEPAWEAFNRGEVNGVLPGPLLATLDLLMDHPTGMPALDVLVTHDTIIGCLAGCLLQAPVHKEYWPGYLEGLFFWRDGDRICVLWREFLHVFGEGFKPCTVAPFENGFDRGD